MIRPHTRPSRTRRTAEVDHRRSGTHFVWKNTGFRASAISQKRISCETSFKTPSATHPPAPLAIPFTLRERSYSCKSQWNSVDRACTKNTWNPICNVEPIRPWSENDPRMIRPHTRPSRTRRTAEVDHRRSGMHFVWKNTGFRASNAFRARLPSKVHRQLIHQHHLQSHLHCGNDPTVASHNGILSTAHARKTLETPFTMRNPSDHGPKMIREWSDHTRDRLAPVAPQR